MPLRRHKQAIGIFRVHNDRRDLLRVPQSQMLPAPPRVDRLVNPIPNGKIWPPQALSTANINRVRIRRRDRQRSDRTSRLIVEDRIPSPAKVVRLPNSAIVRRHIKDIRLPRNSRNSHRASAAKRPNRTPVQFLVHCRVVLLGEKRARQKQHAEKGRQNSEASHAHSWSPI